MKSRLIIVFFGIVVLCGCENCEKRMAFLRGISIDCTVDSVYIDNTNRGYRTIAVTKISGFQPAIGLDGYMLPEMYHQAKKGDIIVKEKGSLRFVLKKNSGDSIECYPTCEGKTYR